MIAWGVSHTTPLARAKNVLHPHFCRCRRDLSLSSVQVGLLDHESAFKSRCRGPTTATIGNASVRNERYYHRLELLGSTCREPVIAIVVACPEFFQPQSQIGTRARQNGLSGHDKGDSQQRKRDLGVDRRLERYCHRLEEDDPAWSASQYAAVPFST